MDIRALAGDTGLLTGSGGASGVDGTAGTQLAGKPKDDISAAFGLGRDDFFRLFLAQLANQDPTKPVDNRELIGQLAQFSMIDTLQAVKTALADTQLAQASSLLGRTIQGVDAAGTAVEGAVERVVQTGGRLLLMVDGRAVSPDGVNVVEASPDSAGPAT